ncbi:MAG: eukaryotic-like serine/threonine-protein kinase [Candidatus Sumerlaeota bacterium]|nr:eukaryotic-like serine/threonine-protein kinase [Candidatus Sumerlaeota bacterium]
MTLVRKKELYRRTIDSLEASCRAHPNNPKLLRQLALSYFTAGYFNSRALAVYEKVSELYPGDMRIQRAMANGYMVSQGEALLRDAPSLEDIDQESLARSVERLSALSTEFPDSPDVHRAVGDLQLIRGEYSDALRHYRSALALGIEEIDPICAHFETLDHLFSMPPNVVAFFAELYQRIGRADKAHRLYRRLIDEGDVAEETLRAYFSFLSRRIESLKHSESAMHQAALELCQISMMLSEEEEALSWALKMPAEVLAQNPKLVKKLARRLIDKGDYRLAFDYLGQIEMDQEVKSLINEIAVVLEQRGELDTAVYLLQYINEHDIVSGGKRPPAREKTPPPEAGEEKPRRSQEWEIEINTEMQLAELHWRNRRWKQAFDAYLRVLEMGFEDYRSILEPLDSLMDRIPDVSEAQLAFLANFFAERRDWRRTLYYAERALFLDPTLDDIRARLMQACEQILLGDPDACEVRLKLGDMHLEKGNFERSMKEYRKASSYPEFSMKANRRIAVALSRAGDTKAAFEKFQELPVLETEDLEHLYDLMISFQNAEQWRLALEAAQLVRDFDPNFRDIEQKIADIEARIQASGDAFTVDPKMKELIGDHAIGRYRYLAKIGSGGMGVVHKVLDLKTNTEVAMKILREGLSSSDKAIDRFFREARIAATLRHRNIVNILDYNISNTYGQSYIAMEFVDGPSLRDIVEDKFAESIEIDSDYMLQVTEWMMQVCDALNATHQKGIIHRDIKPDNILLGQGNVIKLTDFGIVHIEEATFTPTGALIGTPRYMSPEQVHGGRIDARSDIYSVGIIIYEMLIGSPPFISGDISYQQVNVLPTNPREICERVPADLDAIVTRCLEKNPADRFQTVLDLKSTLELCFVQNGGNPDRLNPQSRQAVLPLLASSTEVATLASLRSSETAIRRHLVQRPTDTEFESELDMDDAGENQDRTDRMARPASTIQASSPVPHTTIDENTPIPEKPSAPPSSVDLPSGLDIPQQPEPRRVLETDFDLGDEHTPPMDQKLETDFDLGTGIEDAPLAPPPPAQDEPGDLDSLDID